MIHVVLCGWCAGWKGEAAAGFNSGRDSYRMSRLGMFGYGLIGAWTAVAGL